MMIYLIQHAQAKSKEEDPNRPITDQGREEITNVSEFISENIEIEIKRIYHSGKTRAKQTAEVLNEYLQPPEGIEQADGLDPEAEVEVWLRQLNEIQEDTMLVGHLPHLNKLTSRLLGENENKKMVDFRNAGIVCLVKSEDDLWLVLWVIIPELLT